MIRTCRNFLLILALLLTSAQMVLAAEVTITPSGNGVFIISGSGMDAVAGVDLKVSYDAALLASPAVTQGSVISGAMMAVNTNQPGSIRIAAVSSTRPFPASGQIATISFATHTGTGRISAISSLINSKGSPVPGGGETVAFDSQSTPGSSPGLITTAGVPFSQSTTNANTTTSGTSGSPSTTPAQTSSGGLTLPGTISLTGDVPPQSEVKPAETAAVPPPAVEPIPIKPSEPPMEASPAPKPQKNEPVKMTVIKGALENFSTFKGEKNPANFIALLTRQNSATIRQEPLFALSDGKTALKISAELKNIGDKSPNFALQGARLVSLAADNDSSTWTITAQLQTGISQASLTILTDREIIEFPLTVAPPIGTITAAEADFTAFLKDSGAIPPKRDLNSDGIHDYLDDFIYTVNYLSKKGAVGKTAK